MCRHLGLHRSTFAYEGKEPYIWLRRLRGAVRKLSHLHSELGTRKIGSLLRKGGWRVGSKASSRDGLVNQTEEAQETA